MKNNRFVYNNKVYKFSQLRTSIDHIENAIHESCSCCAFQPICNTLNLKEIVPEHLRCSSSHSAYYKEVPMVELMLEEFLQ